ncbi:MAG: hypothetical protein ABIJ56_22385, partial [Pseudomonadota bacterium]
LLSIGDRVFMLAQCIVIDMEELKEIHEETFIGVFTARGGVEAGDLEWAWMGRLTDHDDALALGGQVLTQLDVARSRRGPLLLIATPGTFEPEEIHQGCRVMEVESLDPPRLRRDGEGDPVVLAEIRASDNGPFGPGACGYDPASDTGVLFVTRDFDLEPPGYGVLWHLRATGIHP